MTLPESDDVTRIAVLGFGIMGHTWTTALLAGGLEVSVCEANAQTVADNTPRVRNYLERMAQKGKHRHADGKRSAESHGGIQAPPFRRRFWFALFGFGHRLSSIPEG